MPNGSEQASAYLSEAETTLDSARVLFENDPEAFASQIVKNTYDALEQALSAGIAARGEDIPRRHGATLLCRLAECIDSDAIDETVDWCPDEIQRPEKPEGMSGLLQALLGQAAEFRQPRLH